MANFDHQNDMYPVDLVAAAETKEVKVVAMAEIKEGQEETAGQDHNYKKTETNASLYLSHFPKFEYRLVSTSLMLHC